MYKKNFIEINPLLDKEKYIIFEDLRKDGRSIVEDTGSKNDWWKGLARELGQESKNILINGERAIMPPISNHEHKIGVVVIGKNISIREEKIGDKIRYIFE
jgi:hypothetical protein